jgi:hypothetical protein
MRRFIKKRHRVIWLLNARLYAECAGRAASDGFAAKAFLYKTEDVDTRR